VPEVPEGWQGPFSADLTDSVPDCPPEFPDLAYEGGSAPAEDPAQCGACQCENCTGGSCAQRLNFFTDAKCSTSAGMVTPVANTCGQRPASAVAVKMDYAKTIATVACDAVAGTTEVPAPRWLDRVRLCGGQAEAGQCEGNEVCVPSLGEPERSCVVADGNKSCPAGYPERHVISSGLDDSRACDCQCQGDVTCTATSQSLLRNICGSTQTYTVLTLDACVAIPGNQPIYTTGATTAAPKAVATALAVGKIVATDTLTVCCVP
jgi:hypothetical protein